MKAGTYYVGDLCYVMDDDEWDQFCAITIDNHSCLDGEFVLPDGRAFASYSTAYGDGTYQDQYGNEYSVDAGLIGCILVSDIKANKYPDISALGAIVEFTEDFTTGSENGIIQFGHIQIDTDAWDADEE